MRKIAILAALFALVPFTLAACGDDDDDDDTTAITETGVTGAAGGGGGGGETVDVTADPGGDLAFQEDSLTASAGTPTFAFTNDASLPHDFCIEEADECTDQISDGDTEELTVELEAGDYTFYCSVPGHREAGMEGELTIE